jgi:hypothetical protein
MGVYCDSYLSTFSGSAITKLFLEMSNKKLDFFFEVLKFKEITREEKNTKISGNLGVFCFRPIFIIGEPVSNN